MRERTEVYGGGSDINRKEEGSRKGKKKRTEGTTERKERSRGGEFEQKNRKPELEV